MKSSYICISSLNPRKELELNNRCLEFHKDKNPIKYGPNYEILIPWTNWNSCHFELFFDYSKGYFYVDNDISIGEYILETEEVIEVFDNNLLNGLASLESKYPTYPLFTLFGNLISSNLNNSDTIKFLISDINNTFNMFMISINLDISTNSYSYKQIDSSISNELKDVLSRRFINSNPKRFESLINVIKN